MRKILTVLSLLLAVFIATSCNVSYSNGEKTRAPAEDKGVVTAEPNVETEEKTDTDEVIPDVTAVTEAPYAFGYPGFPWPYDTMAVLDIMEVLDFDATAMWPEMPHTGVAVNIVSDLNGVFGRPNYKEKRAERINCLNEELRGSVGVNYDDIILVPTSELSEIRVGTRVLVELRTGGDPFYAITLIRLHPGGVEGVYEEDLLAMPIIDNRLSIPERLKENTGLYYGYGNLFMHSVDEINECLERIGRGDLRFYDGMTLEELERFVPLACDLKTFRRLIRELEGQQ